MREYHVILSMGHDTELRDIPYHVAASSREEAYRNAVDRFFSSKDFRPMIDKVFKNKGLEYLPYGFIENCNSRAK